MMMTPCFLSEPHHYNDAQLLALQTHLEAIIDTRMAAVDNRITLLIAVLMVLVVLVVLVALLFWKMGKMDVKMGKMDVKMGKMEKNQIWMMITTSERVDFWNERTRFDPAPISRAGKLAKDAADYYGCSGNDAGGIQKLKCALTGKLGKSGRNKKHEVVVAHLLRRNNPDFAFTLFGLDATYDRDGMRNVMLLCKGLKEAFDTKQISFYQVDGGKHCMRVWDENVRHKQIWTDDGGDVVTIGECEGKTLEFPDGKIPYTRILSYHHRLCFYNAKVHNWIDENEEAPENYGSSIKAVPSEIEIINEIDNHFLDQMSLTGTPSKQSNHGCLTNMLTEDSTAPSHC